MYTLNEYLPIFVGDDLQNAQQRAIVQRETPQRVEEISIGFIRLLPQHFVEHHDIPFYAERLHFADTPSFSKFFSRLSGQSPRAYREKF